MNIKKLILLSSIASCGLATATAQELPALRKNLVMIDNSVSPYDKIRTIEMDDCHWGEGFWGDRFNLCHNVMIPNIWDLVNDPEVSHIFENFKIAGGEAEGEFKGFLFGDGDFFKIVEAMCYDYAITKDPKIDKLMDKIIATVGKAQDKDGYITTGKTISHGSMMNFDHTYGGEQDATARFSIDRDHEFYNFGHIITAGCIHYRVTGKKNFLDIAIKAADCLYDNFHIPTPEKAAIHWNAPHFMGLVELYRTTGDKKYLELTKTYIDMLGTSNQTGSGRGLDHSQKRIPFKDEREAVGHAVHANYLYCGIADYVAETGDKELQTSLDSIWVDAMHRKMYVTGAFGSHTRAVSHEGVVGESYGETYDLPNSRCYTETCANISNVMWNWRTFLATGKAECVDIMELALFNSVLSGISLDGKHFFYKNPLRFIDTFQPEHFSEQSHRSSYLNCFCCPPNVVRTVAQLNNYAYSVSEKGIFVNLYGGNNLSTELLDGSKVELSQETRYPWFGDIKITLDKVGTKEAFSLMLRIPNWAEGATVNVNGEALAGVVNGEYYDCNRKWKKGDVVSINLPMETKLMAAHPYVEDVTGQVAIQRGPIVYCLESRDLPKGTNIQDIVIPADITLKESYHADLLDGVTILEGTALLKETQSKSELYSPIKSVKTKPIDIQLVPYYSWNNRGLTNMTVWLPLSY